MYSISEFVALARGARRRHHPKSLPPFPLRKFRKLSPKDDPRNHIKTIALVNKFLQDCSEQAKHEAWWQVFCCGEGFPNIMSERRQKVRAWNQYFTPSIDAHALMDVTKGILAEMGKSPSVWVEPAAGAGAICSLFPNNISLSVCIEVDPMLCDKYGWYNHNFLTLSRAEILQISGNFSMSLPAKDDVVVVTNPPFVEYSESDDGEPTRDGALAAKFVRHSLQLGNIVVMLLPERFTKQEVRDAAIFGCEGCVTSKVHGEVRRTHFHLGQEKFKKITQPCVIVSFVRNIAAGRG